MKNKKGFVPSVLSQKKSGNIGALRDIEPIVLSDTQKNKLLQKMESVNVTKDAKDLPEQEIVPSSYRSTVSLDTLKRAPEEWSFFGDPTPEKYMLILASIYRYGLWNPITVWEQEDGTHLVLSGNVRIRAYMELKALTGDGKYDNIPCKVYRKNALTETVARRIIILSNIAQRAQEAPRLRVRCYTEMAKLEKKEAFYGSGIRIPEALAKLFDVSRTQVMIYLRLAKLIPDAMTLLDENQITLDAAYIMAGLSPVCQETIVKKNYFRQFSGETLRELKFAMNEADVERIFSEKILSEKVFRYTITSHYERPKGYAVLPIFFKEEDAEVLRGLIGDILQGSKAKNLSEETKKELKKLLES